jgi:hypothetical protein
MSDSSPDLPEVEARDPEAVAVAIETARALLRSGDRLDALRWLRRAAERAEEAGDDARAVTLARSAADLSTALQTTSPPSSRDEAAALAPYDDFSDKTVVDTPATAIVREALQSGVQINELASSGNSPRAITMPSPPTIIPAAPVSAPPQPKPTMRQALRVAVAPDPDRPGGLLVRPLPEGAPVATGSEEALLIALAPNSRLFQ